jgi:hypothetical protein
MGRRYCVVSDNAEESKRGLTRRTCRGSLGEEWGCKKGWPGLCEGTFCSELKWYLATVMGSCMAELKIRASSSAAAAAAADGGATGKSFSRRHVATQVVARRRAEATLAPWPFLLSSSFRTRTVPLDDSRAGGLLAKRVSSALYSPIR